jgi:hypothetical protein
MPKGRRKSARRGNAINTSCVSKMGECDFGQMCRVTAALKYFGKLKGLDEQTIIPWVMKNKYGIDIEGQCLQNEVDYVVKCQQELWSNRLSIDDYEKVMCDRRTYNV